MDAGLCVSRSSPTEVDGLLGWFGNACVDEERYTRGQVAEAALTPETRTERRELSMVNLGGGMCVALQGGCIATQVDRLPMQFGRTCVGPPHVTVPVAGRLLVVLILAPTFRNLLRQTAEIQAGLMFAWWAYPTPCPP